MSARVVHGSSLCLTLARAGLDDGGRLKDPAQEAALRGALEALAAAVAAP